MNASKNQVPTQGTEKKVVTTVMAKPTVEQKPTAEVRKMPTLEELKNRATIIHLLSEKHDELTKKRNSLNKFTIAHESDNATVIVRDVNGLKFESTSPKTIGKLLEFWKEEFDDAIREIEEKLRTEFEVEQANEFRIAA